MFSAALMTAPALAFAQDDDLLAGTDEVLNSSQIDIDGSYEQRRESAADRIAKLRQRLEKQNLDMMHKKIEHERIKSEKKLEKKLRHAFTGMSLNSDRVQVKKAAPQRIVAPAPVVKPKKVRKTAVIPSIGVSEALSSGSSSYESKVSAGLSVDHTVHNNISVGFGLSYSKMDFKSPYIQNFNFVNFQSVGPNSDGNADYEYSRIAVNLNTKFFFTGIDSKFRPYAGVGLGYNRVRISDTNPNDDYLNIGGLNFNQNPNQETEFSDSLVSASALIGANFLFNHIVGVNVNFTYTKFLTSAFSSDEQNQLTNSFNRNENEVRAVGESVSDRDVAGFNIGLVLKF